MSQAQSSSSLFLKPEVDRKPKSLAHALRVVPLFAPLKEHELDRIASAAIERHYAKGTVILEEGLAGNFMYIIREGQVKLTVASGDGRERIASLLYAGDFFGELALIDGLPRLATATALEPTGLLALSREVFLDLLARNAELAMELIHVLAFRLREADRQATALSFLGVRERTRRVLLHLCESQPAPGLLVLGPPVTHQQIADMVGSSRETVTRAIQQLKGAGELEQRGKRYGLRQLAPIDISPEGKDPLLTQK